MTMFSVFDKGRIYTAVNADEVKKGSKGYFADDLVSLHNRVREGLPLELLEVDGPDKESRFVCDGGLGNRMSWALFYLVAEPEEKKARPYRSTEEMAKDYKARFVKIIKNGGFPFMWLTPKDCEEEGDKTSYFVTGVSGRSVVVNNAVYSMGALLDCFTYLDGSPCGKLEEQE